MAIQIYVGGSWRSVSSIQVFVGGQWKTLNALKVQVSSVWKDAWAASGPSPVNTYNCGGYYNSPSWLNVIQRLAFSTETISTISATLSSGRQYMAPAYNSNYGYLMGGQISGSVLINAIDRLAYSTETCSNISATLPTNTWTAAGEIGRAHV